MHLAASNRGSFAALAVAIAASPLALAQPANNACVNAPLVTAGTIAGTTVGATNDGTGSCGSSGSSPDVWYRYTAVNTGQINVTTCGAASWDTVLSVWSGCPSAGGAEIACVDDACSLQTTVQANVTAGVTYLIRVAGFGGATGAFSITISEQDAPPGGTVGPDVIYSDISGITSYGPVGNIWAYAFGTSTCNIGDVNLHWGNSWAGTPSVGFNAYRLHNGRLMQIGQSWVKRACCAAAGSGCSLACNGQGGSVLGTGCRDVYSAGYNGSQSNLAKRSSLNAFSGAHALVGGSGDAIFGRLQIVNSDMDPLAFPGLQLFGEGVYVGADDAPAGNAFNNASYRRMTGSGAGLALSGTTVIGTPAIQAWHDHGLGAGVPDPSVTVESIDIPNEGRYIVAEKVTNRGNGTWTYDYAIFNLNSDRSGGSFSIPIPAGVTVTNAGFHDVPYHSGEPYDNTDWTITVGSGAVTWSSPQTYAQNQNSNALRWGTMYNFWFDANRAPTTGNATFGLFKPHTPQTITFSTNVPSNPSIPGDLNGDGHVDLTDLAMLLSDFGCTTPVCVGDVDGDGDTDIADLTELLSNYGL